MSDDANPPKREGSGERVAAVLIGALFVGVSLAILAAFMHDLSVGPVLAAVVIGGLGIEALLSAARNRRCLLSRI
jgi:hypothetical protein